jgi:hypothetical protein
MTDVDNVTITGLTQVEIMHILFKLMGCKCDTCKSISHKIGIGLKGVSE